MASLNKVMIIGNLGKDPELKTLPSGTQVCNFSVATTENWLDGEGEKKEDTQWHRIVVFGKLADICGKYLAKGRSVYIEGRLQTRKWQDRDGNDKYTTEVVASLMLMLDKKGTEKPQANSDDRPGASHPEAQPPPKEEDADKPPWD